MGNPEINRNFVGCLLICYTTKHFIQHNIHIKMILRIEIPQELIRQDAEIVIKVSNRNNALGYVIEKGSEHDAQQIVKEDMNGGPTLGEYVRPDDLETLGFVPAVLAPRVRAVGNTALDGAALLALHSKKIPPLARMCREAVVLPLVDEPNFHTDYLRRMRFGV